MGTIHACWLLLLLLLLHLSEGLPPSQTPDEFAMLNCTEVNELWKGLCLEGRCRPRSDGGCTKFGAAGICSTIAGCLQGDVESKLSVVSSTTPPNIFEEAEVLFQPLPMDQRYLNVIQPDNGHVLPAASSLHVKVHAEVVLSYGELSSMYNVEGGEGISLYEGDEISVSSLGLGGYMMIYLDGREHQTMLNGSSFHTVRLLEDVAFTDERQRQSLIVLVQFELESLVGGIHSVEIQLGSNGPDRISYPPCQFWFLVETQEVRGERESWWLTQSGLLMSRIQELEEQVLFLRSQLESHDVKHKRIQERKSRAPKHLVFELGANDGAWIRDFCEKNPGFQPHIFEPQPRFAQPLSDIARKFNGHFHQKAVWKHDGEKIRFHAHSDEGGIGSSIMNDHAYHQCGSKVCEQDFSQEYDVETVDIVRYIKEVALPQDVIFLRMDIEGAEYEVIRKMITSGVACWLDYLEFEGHAMYSPQTYKYRAVDAVVPWLLHSCGVQTLVQDWYTEDWKVWRSWNLSSRCVDCAIPVITD
uniref:Methyltransferase FkbM domain-containing protein n=1 Tax=Guillardia theta TaxID=55529 RepID=A0A7S4K0C1_GUITH|mmetsp:Transcript_20015/g.66564  ORF Transcript_20015/g.66564 Transcript_20015/m.66564 type:complete len:528 (+) Transcript_20015:89-1672(+)